MGKVLYLVIRRFAWTAPRHRLHPNSTNSARCLANLRKVLPNVNQNIHLNQRPNGSLIFTYPLLLFPLFGHLVPEVSQLRGEGLDQVLGLVQLAVEGLPVVLLHGLLFHVQRDGAEAGEPFEAALLKNEEIV